MGFLRLINRRKSIWTTVLLQPEKDLFECEIQPNLPETAKFRRFNRLQNPKISSPYTVKQTSQLHNILIYIITSIILKNSAEFAKRILER